MLDVDDGNTYEGKEKEELNTNIKQLVNLKKTDTLSNMIVVDASVQGRKNNTSQHKLLKQKAIQVRTRVQAELQRPIIVISSVRSYKNSFACC